MSSGSFSDDLEASSGKNIALKYTSSSSTLSSFFKNKLNPDSRLMRVDSQRLEVSYNIQTSVDAKQHLIVDYEVINNSTDHHQLAKDALAAKQILGVDELDVLSDKGFFVEQDIRP